jgi:hypothetical protein
VKENRLEVQISKPVSEVFEFTINPQNTPLWIKSIVHEETNEWPVKIGSIYKNKNLKGEWAEYVVINIEPNKVFELLSKDNNYHVRYFYKSISNNSSELEYHEWVDNGELDNPFPQGALGNLKRILD